ncbi:TPA: P-loop NTPase fold protein [Clostridioides difficile]|nr:P-loop NTPase fold protein [Clostridioides difficile]MDE3609781.1 P-loop NTPase fold protein [Clostridioides difficile]MDM9790949.1 P-loop NTPase fold protein [Clostridioides difficile]
MWVDRESGVDLLSYEPFAELVKNILLDETMNPLTIGLFGSWGAGKSTLLKLVDTKLSNKKELENKRIATVFLNAWAFEGYDDAKSALMESLLLELQDNVSEFKNVKNKISTLIRRLDFFRIGKFALKYGVPAIGSAFTPVGLAGSAAYLTSQKDNMISDAKDIVREEIKDAQDEAEKKNDVINNIRKFKKEFEELIIESKIDNLVVMIDDLDRCSPERIIETLEAIKLFLSVPKTTFIIAIDDSVIKYSVKKTYPKIDDDDFGIVDNYIEKIIQLPIYIPELSEQDITNYLLFLVIELYFEESVVKKLSSKLTNINAFFSGITLNQQTIKECIPEIKLEENLLKGKTYQDYIKMFEIVRKVAKVISLELKGNPRQAKRFLNTFLVRKKLGEIYSVGEKSTLDYEVLAQLTALEYLDKNVFRELYKAAMKTKNTDKVQELCIIKNIIENGEEIPKEFFEWDKPSIINWVKNTDIVNVSGKELLSYFYLSRESLHINFSAVDELTVEERKAFNEYMKLEKPLALKNSLDRIKKNNNLNLDNIIKAIIDSSRNDIKLLKKCVPIYTHYEMYRNKIIEVIVTMKEKDLNMNIIMTLNNLYRIDKNIFKSAIDYFKEIKVDQKKLDLIIKED